MGREPHLRILVADNHRAICEMLGQYLTLKSEELFQREITVRSAFTLADAILAISSSTEEGKPHYVLLDLNFEHEGFFGTATVEQFQKANHHNIPVVIYTGTDVMSKDGIQTLRACVNDHRIMGILLKTADISQLSKAIKIIIDGDQFFPAEYTRIVSLPEEPGNAPSDVNYFGLTKREREIVRLMCSDKKIYTMAQELEMSEGWLSQRLSKIYRKLGVHSRYAAVAKIRKILD